MRFAKINKYAFTYSIFYSGCSVLGKKIYEINDIRKICDGNIIFLLLELICTGIITYVVISLLSFLTCKKLTNNVSNQQLVKGNSRLLFILWPGMVLCWLPAFFAFYPGINSYDFSVQAQYALGEGFSLYTTHHPPLHTMYIDLVISLAMKLGVAAVTLIAIFQIIVMSLVFCCFVLWILQREKSVFVGIIAYLFFAFNPVISIFVLTPTKDVFFAMGILLFTMEFIELTEHAENMNLYKYLLSGVTILFCCLLRNNMVYGFILSLPFILNHFRTRWKPIACLFITSIIVFFMVNNILFIKIMGMEPGEKREMFCVPIQQLANVVVNCEEGLTQGELESLKIYFNYEKIVTEYNPRFADPVKNLFKEEIYAKEKGTFWKSWLKIGLEHPVEYINGFLFLNMPYWYPGANLVDPYSNAVYIETGDFAHSYNKLYPFFSQIASGERLNLFFHFGGLFSLATPLWGILLTIVIMLMNKKQKYIITMAPILGLLFTFFIGPVSNFRYIYVFVCLYPMLFYLCIHKE